ncbi:hypothetical protein DSCO28_71020 [Desulfosarcina ovata subsp. sediminis]|uniref:PEP-CTERM protein-sorting domain-containing protein n=1 Tax=Desulfosarcina ovata subsp. sediminis TaxID=885957 RepID=A0A5K8A264_9BACT|nr:hypothetical protein [Desulfosarcina ovata]BBO86536.1 hypothetical protein DSCO28_71020 [Desulfosarcina ovata subsp. sediminis]
MVKKITILATLIVLLAFMTTSATAWEIELQSSDNLTWDILFTSDAGGNDLAGYFLDFNYDTDELNWEDLEWYSLNAATEGYVGIYTNTPPTEIDADFSGKPIEREGEDGFITNFNGFTLGSAVVDGTVSLGTLTFTEVSSVVDGVADLQLALDSVMFGMIIDDGAPVEDLTVIANQEGYFAATTNPVPIPGAVWLLGSGFLTLAGIRRKNRE